MKRTSIITIPLVACALVSCDFNQPLPNNGYNPLDTAGGNQAAATDPNRSLFTPGAFLQTVSPMTAFYSKYPKDMEQPNKTLPDNTDVKVISINHLSIMGSVARFNSVIIIFLNSHWIFIECSGNPVKDIFNRCNGLWSTKST